MSNDTEMNNVLHYVRSYEKPLDVAFKVTQAVEAKGIDTLTGKAEYRRPRHGCPDLFVTDAFLAELEAEGVLTRKKKYPRTAGEVVGPYSQTVTTAPRARIER